MDEFGGPSGGAPPGEEDFSKMSIEDRLKHKNWKARSSAYEELAKKFAATAYDTDPEFKPYTRNPDLLKAMVTDANVVAQEKGVNAVAEFVKYGGKAAGATREVVLPAVVEKGLGSTRAGTKKAAIELALLYAENEDVMGSDSLVADIVAGLSAKQPKLVAGSVTALKELIKEFGPKQVSPKPILKKLPDIFAHSDKTVRSEGSLLAQELHKYLGPALAPTIDSLKDIQAKELRAQFEEIDKAGQGKPVPPRNLLSQKAAAEAAAEAMSKAGTDNSGSGVGKGGAEVADQGDEGEFDAYEMAEPVDPLKARDWPANFDEQIKAAKWSERKEVLEAAKNVLSNNIKLAPGPAFDNFVDACMERVRKDATVHVWLMACHCLEAAAKGMRQDFAKYRERTMPHLLERLKEKKASTVEVLANTLDAIFQTVSFGDILEDVLTAAKHKNPNVKTESIRFLARCLRETRKAPAKSDIKPIADALLAACSDGSGDVRDAGTQGMGTLMKLIGERPMNAYLDQLDDIKKGKVQEEYKVATVKVKIGGGPPPAARPAPTLAPRPPASAAGPPKPRIAARPSPGNKENAPPSRTSSPAPSASRPAAAPVSRGPPSRLMASRPPASASTSAKPAPRSGATPAAARPAPGGKGAPRGAPSVNEPVKFRFNPEEAEARASELVPPEIAAQLANANWKERLAGIQAFSSWLDREAESVESELIIRSLSKKPGWKESNFQVMAEVYKVFRLLAEQCPTFGRASVALSIQPLCDKLGDIKLKTPASDTLGVFSESTSFAFVVKQALGPLSALKAPKAIADSLLWIDGAIVEFGIQAVDVRSLVDHLITCLKSANAAVRNNATTVMGTLARYLGSSLSNFLGDLNPQLKSTIEGEIAKAVENPAPAPTRFSAELKPAASASGGNDGDGGEDGSAASAAAEEDALDALIPRVDVDKLIPSSAISSLGDANWKARKEALEEIQGILAANTRLKGSLNELTPALKLRYADSNLMCKTLALDIAAKLSTGLGKNFEPQAKTYVTPITLCLADAKAPLRQSALTTLTAIADAVGADNMTGGMAAATEGKGGANPLLRQELFGWLAARFESHPPGKSYDLAPLALPAVQCLDDKLAAVKKAALAALPYIIQRAGYKFVCSQADSMKAASKNTVLPLIDQARSAAAALAPSKSAAAAPSAGPAQARTAPVVKRAPAVVAAAASSPRPSSPMGRSASPAPAATASPRSSGLARPGLARPPSAATRSLQTPSSRIASGGFGTPSTSSGLARPSAVNSRLGLAKRAVMASSGGVSAPTEVSTGGDDKTSPFQTSDPKHKATREKKDGRGANWVSAEGTARPGLGEVLKAQCEHYLGASLIDAMFSTDHNAERDYLSALAVLTDFVSSPTYAEEEYGVSPSEAVSRVVANSDLVFKYIALRLTDNNTSISLKCFELLGHLLDLLRTEQYHMSDYESSCILPCLIAKFGDAKVAFRDRIRETFRKLTFIYPPSKLLTQYLENGLPSKNARTRAECLGELGYLFSKNGLQVCAPAKTLPVIAKQISDRDTNVRTAALLALGECYKIVGEEIWTLVGRLPEKEMSLLEERLKRTTVSRPVASKAFGQSTTAGPSSPASGRMSIAGSGIRPPASRSSSGIVPPSAGGAAARSKLGMPGGIPKPTAGRTSMLPASAGPANNGSPHASSSVGGQTRLPAAVMPSDTAAEAAPEEMPGKDTAEQEHEDTQLEEDEDGQPDIEQTINEILSSDSERSTFALKAINQEMAAYPAPFAPHVNQLAEVLAKQFSRAFKLTDAEDAKNARLKKYLVQVSSSLFDGRNKCEEGNTIASYLDNRALSLLMTQLLQRLIDSSHRAREEDEARLYATYLNKIVIRCFATCNLNVLYTTSFAMLGDASEDVRELSAETQKTRFEFSELLMKCLWKMGRRLPNALQDDVVDASQLMSDTATFLQRITPEEWKSRAADGLPLQDMPLRTVKVILSHLASALGEDVLNHFDKVENPEQSHVYTYVIALLNKDEEVDVDDENMVKGGKSEDTPRKRASDSSSSATVEDTAGAELRDIFERISQKEQSRQAIKDLYDFQKRYPAKQSSIDRSLHGTGPIFQRYIKRALANHAAEDDQAATTSAPAKEPSRNDVRVSTSAMSSSRDSDPHTNGVNRPASNSQSIGMGRPSSIRSSINNGGASAPSETSPSRRTSSTSSHARVSSTSTNAAAEERLAQLRAKFYKKTPASPNASGSAGEGEHNAEI